MSLLGWMLFRLPTLLHLTVILVSANLQNITVDDTMTSAFILAPKNEAWEGSPSCNGCSTPQKSGSTYAAATWDDPTSTVFQNLTFTFTGSALYVYGIISQSDEAHYSFFLDGQPSEPPFIRNETSSTNPVLYNQTLYSNPSIPNGQHTFVLQNGQPGVDFSLLLFDYLIYTQDGGSGTTSSTVSTTAPLSASEPTSTATTQTSSSSATGSDTTSDGSTSPSPISSLPDGGSLARSSSGVAVTNKPIPSGAPTPPSAGPYVASNAAPNPQTSGGATAPVGNLHSSPSHGLSAHSRTLIIGITVTISCILLAFLAFYCLRRRRRRRAAAEVDLDPFDDNNFARDTRIQPEESEQGSVAIGRITNSHSVTTQLEKTMAHDPEEAFTLDIGERRSRSFGAISQLDLSQSERNNGRDGSRNINDDYYGTVSERERVSTPSFVAAFPTSSVTSLSLPSPSPRPSITSVLDRSTLDTASQSYPESTPPSYTSEASTSSRYISPHTRSPSAVASVSTSSLPPPSYTSNRRSNLNRMRSFRSVGVGSAWSHEGVTVPDTPLPGYNIEDRTSRL